MTLAKSNSRVSLCLWKYRVCILAFNTKRRLKECHVKLDRHIDSSFPYFIGTDYDTAVQILTATNFDVQEALDLHITEPTGSNNILPEDRVAGND